MLKDRQVGLLHLVTGPKYNLANIQHWC